jgi:hypothetical protein
MTSLTVSGTKKRKSEIFFRTSGPHFLRGFPFLIFAEEFGIPVANRYFSPQARKHVRGQESV